MANFLKSSQIFIIALITPFLVWVLLFSFSLSRQSRPSFDPSPRIQSYVDSPRPFSLGTGENGWWHVINHEGQLAFKNADGTTAPLSTYTKIAQAPVFYLEAQGPRMAQNFYAFLKDNELTRSSLILSPSDGLLKDLRFHDPELSLSCGQAYIVRLRALEQLGLQNLLTINMSGVLLNPEIFGSSLNELTEYFHSHKVPVFIGPVSAAATASLPKNANFLLVK